MESTVIPKATQVVGGKFMLSSPWGGVIESCRIRAAVFTYILQKLRLSALAPSSGGKAIMFYYV